MRLLDVFPSASSCALRLVSKEFSIPMSYHLACRLTVEHHRSHGWDCAEALPPTALSRQVIDTSEVVDRMTSLECSAFILTLS